MVISCNITANVTVIISFRFVMKEKKNVPFSLKTQRISVFFFAIEEGYACNCIHSEFPNYMFCANEEIGTVTAPYIGHVVLNSITLPSDVKIHALCGSILVFPVIRQSESFGQSKNTHFFI